MKISYEKNLIALRYWLHGRNYFKALEALELGLSIHTGLRKDGRTKEFEHQVVQALYVKTVIESLLFPEETLVVVLLHDTVEDYDITYDTLNKKFGSLIADAVFRMSKKVNGIKKSEDHYFAEISECPMCSFAKPVDRFHNLLSMDGVFKLEKQKEYIAESEEKIIPLAKAGRRKFPFQEPAYENIKLVLNQQIALYRSMHKLWDQTLEVK
jgi:(p)ppGpp synthase/HD superfamily hydrolase